jgi:hypothetical protein
VKVIWTAFKTPKKLGVNGTFSKIDLQGHFSGNSIKEIVTGSSIKINSQSVDTKDKGRDANISENFFKKVTGDPVITASVESMDEHFINLHITMNNKKILVPLSYKIHRNKLEAKGTLDIFDFGMADSLKSLAEVCKEKHEDKSWNDVDLKLEANFKKKCK